MGRKYAPFRRVEIVSSVAEIFHKSERTVVIAKQYVAARGVSQLNGFVTEI